MTGPSDQQHRGAVELPIRRRRHLIRAGFTHAATNLTIWDASRWGPADRTNGADDESTTFDAMGRVNFTDDTGPTPPKQTKREAGYAMTNEVVQEINDAITTCGLAARLRLLGVKEAARVLQDVREQLVEGHPRVWWLSFKHGAVKGDPTQPAPEQIRQLLGEQTTCFFIPEPDETGGAVFRGDVGAILDVVMECRYFEYYLVSPSFEWTLCENDHNAVVGSVSPRATKVPPGLVALQARQRT